MAISFSAQQWERVKSVNTLWRDRKLGRPLVQWTLRGADAGRPEPSVPPNGKGTTSFNLDYTAEQIVDRWDYDLSTCRFLGDAFPHVWPDFGPGILAAFVGGEAAAANGTVWYYPGEFKNVDPRDMRIVYRDASVWLDRIRDICRAATARWDGAVQVAMTDLGGTLDVLASLRTTETLLTDLYDCPEAVERLTWEIHDCWFNYYDDLCACLPRNPGYSAWAEVFAREPAYMLQCDFAYMIGPEMFDRFVLPELRRSCQRLPGGSFYHQDGIGQLPHTASLHGIPELAGMQWQPGDGQPPACRWTDQLRRIRDDGKLLQTWGGPDELEHMLAHVGDMSHAVVIGGGDIRDEAKYRAVLARHGIE